MRLLTTSLDGNLDLVPFENESTLPGYAILSHRWISGGEVTYQELIAGEGKDKTAGYAKLQNFVQQAAKDGHKWCWMDTCCIDKTNQNELSEAINSMYRWYENSELCYVYLADADFEDTASFARSGWWTRAWTLQELLAPQNVQFFDKTWMRMGDKATLTKRIAAISNIDEQALRGEIALKYMSIAKRMSWAASRMATRVEDIAYSLLGIFDVNMGLRYGEREKAFIRLQEKILKRSDDHSIFAWSAIKAGCSHSGLLAPSPAGFVDAVQASQRQNDDEIVVGKRGIEVNLPLRCIAPFIFAARINCAKTSSSSREMLVYLLQLPAPNTYVRIAMDGQDLGECESHEESLFRAEKVICFEDIGMTQSTKQLLFSNQHIRLHIDDRFEVIDKTKGVLVEADHLSGRAMAMASFPFPRWHQRQGVDQVPQVAVKFKTADSPEEGALRMAFDYEGNPIALLCFPLDIDTSFGFADFLQDYILTQKRRPEARDEMRQGRFFCKSCQQRPYKPTRIHLN